MTKGMTKKITTMSVLAMLALVLTAGVALAANLIGNDRSNSLLGTASSDYIEGRGGGDSLYGLGAGDAIYGGFGNDLIRGGAGNDDPGFTIGPRVKGLYGGLGGDAIYGEGGNDSIVGGAGGDRLVGGPGDDHINSIAGEAVPTGDTIICGRGRDFVEANRFERVAADCETVRRF